MHLASQLFIDTHMHTLRIVPFALAGLLGIERCNAQRTWVVDSLQRPGHQFVAIQPAVDAAAPGDAVVVRAASPYAAPTIGKGIALLAEGTVTLHTDLVIAGLPAGQRVSVKGFRMYDGGNPYGPRPIRCSGCAGTIHLERVRGGGSVHGPALDVIDCAHVSAQDCVLDADGSYGILVPIVYFAGGNVGVRSLRSSVALVNTRALGRAEIGPPNRPGFLGSWSGISCTDSRLVVAGCVVGGGAGACQAAGTFCLQLGQPTPALVARSSTLILRASTFTGGAFTLGTCTGCGPTAPGIDADGATVHEVAHAHVTASGVAPGGQLQIVLDSTVTAPFVTFVSFPAPVIPLPVGLWIDPGQALPIAFGVVNPGARTDTVLVPSFFPLGLPVGVQAVLLQGAALELSTPAVAVLQ